MPIGGWGTVSEASSHFGVTRTMIHKLIKKQALGNTRKISTPRGPIWLIEYPFNRKELNNGRPRAEKEKVL